MVTQAVLVLEQMAQQIQVVVAGQVVVLLATLVVQAVLV
jgi:hypothetical protein